MSDFDVGAPVASDPPAPQTNDSTPFDSPSAAAAALAKRRWESSQNNSQQPRQERAAPAEPEISPEADAAPQHEAPGETDQGPDDPPKRAPIEPPRSWTKEAKELWARIDPDVQEIISQREGDREKEFRREQNEAAERRKALEAQERAVLQERQQYGQQLPALLQALKSIQGSEFADIRSWADVQRMASEDTYRYARWDALQKQTEQAQKAWAHQQHVQQQQTLANFANWGEKQDAEFREYAAKEFADDASRQKAQGEVASYLTQEVGLSGQTLTSMWNDPNGMFHIRDAKVQRILRDAARWNAAEKAAKAAKAKPLPPVQRPGTASSRAEQGASNIQALQQKLDRSGDLRDAAALYAAKKAGARRQG